MKIVAISDTHGRHGERKLPHGDILIHAGDVSMIGRPDEVIDFLNWFEGQPHPHKIFIAGNHDFLFERDPNLVKSLLTGRDIHYLQDQEIRIGSHKIYGSPWQPWFHSWAFNLREFRDLKAKWDRIPEDTNILVTHGPPRGIMDLCRDDRERVGCEALLERVKELKPELHIFGHIHEGYGMVENDYTLFVNACNLNLSYEYANNPIVLSNDSGIWERSQ